MPEGIGQDADVAAGPVGGVIGRVGGVEGVMKEDEGVGLAVVVGDGDILGVEDVEHVLDGSGGIGLEEQVDVGDGGPIPNGSTQRTDGLVVGVNGEESRASAAADRDADHVAMCGGIDGGRYSVRLGAGEDLRDGGGGVGLSGERAHLEYEDVAMVEHIVAPGLVSTTGAGDVQQFVTGGISCDGQALAASQRFGRMPCRRRM